jgi:hypothetical protein
MLIRNTRMSWTQIMTGCTHPKSFSSQMKPKSLLQTLWSLEYHKVASSRQSRLVANPSIFRLFLKGKFDGYIMWSLAQRVQNWIVDRSTVRDFAVFMNWAFAFPQFSKLIHNLSWLHSKTLVCTVFTLIALMDLIQKRESMGHCQKCSFM